MIGAKQIFAYNLRKIRKERDLTQEQLAALVETSLKTISDLENEKYLPTHTTLDKMCKKLNINVSLFFHLPEGETDNEKVSLINQINDRLLTKDIKTVKMIYNMLAFSND